MDELFGRDLSTFLPTMLNPRDPAQLALRMQFVNARALVFRDRMPQTITNGTYQLVKLGPEFPYCGYECAALNLKIPVALRDDAPLTPETLQSGVDSVLKTLAEWIPRLAKDRR